MLSLCRPLRRSSEFGLLLRFPAILAGLPCPHASDVFQRDSEVTNPVSESDHIGR